MDSKQIALRLLLDELGVEPKIKTVAQRKTLQKSVYIGQLAGVDFGYRYNWYVMGPYSPGLTRDYYALDRAVASSHGGDVAKHHELRPSIRRRLARVKPLLDVPAGLDVDQADWLELVASVHYLIVERKKKKRDARKVLKNAKPHVADHMDEALNQLRALDLV